MSEQLEFHVASEVERRAAHANVHDVWSRGLPLDAHVERREGLPLNRRATWYVGVLDGRVVTSLGSHPLLYFVQGRELPGIGIAAVHTLAEFRGRGFAPRLIDYAERQQRQQGAMLSMLFSDVDPDYYARIGYLRCPAHRGTMLASGEPGPGECSLQSFVASEQVTGSSDLFHSSVEHEPFYVIRTAEYARHLLDRFPHDEFFWLLRRDARCGFVRCYVQDDRLMIRDFAVQRNDDVIRGALFDHLRALARQRGLSAVVGWLPADPITRRYFELVDRPQEITMLKPLVDDVRISDACLAAADRIAEIDHV